MLLFQLPWISSGKKYLHMTIQIMPKYGPCILLYFLILTIQQILEDLLVAQGFLNGKALESVSDVDKAAINRLYEWASRIALPAPVFAESPEESFPESERSGEICF